MRWPLTVLALLLAGCCAPPPEAPSLSSPRLTRTVEHGMGTALAGPQALPPPPPDARPCVVRAWLVAVERISPQLAPIQSGLRLITRPGEEGLLALRPTLFSGARAGRLERPAAEAATRMLEGRATSLGPLDGLLYPGGVVGFALEVDTFQRGEVARAHLTVRIAREPEGGIDLAVEQQQARPVGAGLALSRELIGLESPGAPPLRYGLILPAPLDPAYEGYAFWIEVDLPRPLEESGPGQRRREAEVRLELERRALPVPAVGAAARTRAALSAPPAPPADRLGWARLAAQVGADLVESLALSGSDELVDPVLAALAAPLTGGPPEGAGWRVERAAVLALAERAGAAPRADAGSLAQAFLTERAGGVAFDLRLLEETVAVAQDLPSWRARLVEENRQLLSDPDPNLRARAHAWLVSQDAAVPGFLPLGSPDARREALERFEEGQE
ncbi:MAG: hypothetical protein AB7N76_29535 [Planctomycetota bacterium]